MHGLISDICTSPLTAELYDYHFYVPWYYQGCFKEYLVLPSSYSSVQKPRYYRCIICSKSMVGLWYLVQKHFLLKYWSIWLLCSDHVSIAQRTRDSSDRQLCAGTSDFLFTGLSLLLARSLKHFWTSAYFPLFLPLIHNLPHLILPCPLVHS